MSIDILRDILILSLLVEVSLLVILMSMQIKILKQRRKNYFLKRDRERCQELLYTAKDGYFCFIYPDDKVKDSQKDVCEKASKRLVIMLDLKNGTASSFADVCDAFYKEDALLLKKYTNLLQQDGRAFEDILHLKGGQRHICVYGNRVQGADNSLYCDIVWFRDVSVEVDKIESLKNDKIALQENVKLYESMIDGINYPVWLRDDKLRIIAVNKKYLEYVGIAKKDEVLKQSAEISDNKGMLPLLKLAQSAQKSQKMQKHTLNVLQKGELHNFEAMENPYFIGDELDKIGTVGYLIDQSALERAKRNFKINQNTHLEILGGLGTAFAIFDTKMHLYFYNNSFRDLWNLDNDFLEKSPSYLQFIETIREHKLLPTVPDFKSYKQDEISVFGNLLETKEDLLHLPDGRTIRRLRMPHPNGVIFAFEDVSDRLATKRRLNELTAMQQSILDNLNDGVIIFDANRRLKFYNRAYLKMWGMDVDRMTDEPKLDAIISYQKIFFANVDEWDKLKETMIMSILEGQKFILSRDDDKNISVSPMIFYDGSIMLTYTQQL